MCSEDDFLVMALPVGTVIERNVEGRAVAYLKPSTIFLSLEK